MRDHRTPAAGTLGTALGSLGTALIVDTGSSAGIFLRGAELWSTRCPAQGGPGWGMEWSLFPSPLGSSGKKQGGQRQKPWGAQSPFPNALLLGKKKLPEI